MPATDPYRLPVVVGVGQLRSNRERTLADACEPLELILDATRRALVDSAADKRIVGIIDGVDVVRVVTWAYDDLPQQVADGVGCAPSRLEHADVGGNQPVALVDRAAARVAAGQERAVLICGGETRASMGAFTNAGVEPPWTRTPGGPVKWPPGRYASELALRYGLGVPLRGYPMYENARRARFGETHERCQRASAELLAEFSEVAVKNDSAWDPVARTVSEIETVSAKNRMLCFPYTLLMVAQPTVDQAAAVIVTSVGRARELGIPETRMVHVWGGAGCADSTDLLSREDYSRSPAMERALERTLSQAGVLGADLDIVDLYSCYPIVPKLALESLRLRDGVPRTATGGLNAFGAPANNYSLHAIVSVVSGLRNHGSIGLVYGNGEIVTKHHALLLGASEHADGYVGTPDPMKSPAGDIPPIADMVDGPAVLETYTVEYSRDGAPVAGYVVGRTASGNRFAAHSYDHSTLARLVDTSVEAVGCKGSVRVADDGLNHFEID